MSDPKIKRVLVSVTDKTGVADFARALVDEFGGGGDLHGRHGPRARRTPACHVVAHRRQ